MPLTRLYEEAEVAPALRRIYSDIRLSFDLPFVPSIFKQCAGAPRYLSMMWNDLGPVVRSREFQSCGLALEEFIHSQTVAAGWQFQDQQRVLASQKFSQADIQQLAAMVGIFARALPRMALFARLLQRGYSGGQKGSRLSSGKQASAVSRMVTVHIPNESDAGLRTWLIYHDIKRTTGTRTVMSLFRALSPFPGYLNSVWLDCKKVTNDARFAQAREQVAKRTLATVTGLPVNNHRAEFKGVTSQTWSDIEQMVDGFAAQLPQFALLAAAWQRSFPRHVSQVLAA